MSLPFYEAIGFQNILEKGGHSKPWVVTVNVGMLLPTCQTTGSPGAETLIQLSNRGVFLI